MGPAADPWCMSRDGRAASCSSADKFSIKCKRCGNGKDYRGCSIRDESDGSKCMKWDVKLGAMVTAGDVRSSGDCPHRVEFYATHIKSESLTTYHRSTSAMLISQRSITPNTTPGAYLITLILAYGHYPHQHSCLLRRVSHGSYHISAAIKT